MLAYARLWCLVAPRCIIPRLYHLPQLPPAQSDPTFATFLSSIDLSEDPVAWWYGSLMIT